MNSYIEVLDKVSYAIFASVGGILFYLLGVTETGRGTNFRILLIYGLSSGFIGQITLLLCRAANLNIDLTGALTGIAGALGARTTISILEIILFKYLGIKRYDRRKNPEE